MGQTYYEDTYAGGRTASTDLTNIETNWATIKSLWSGSSAPATTVAGMPYFDTNNDVLKVRNAADDAWRGMMHADGNSFKILVYRNDEPDGWSIDTANTADRVVAVKNHGSGTYTTGGATAGNWNNATGLSSGNESSHTHEHNHQIYKKGATASSMDQYYNSGGTAQNLSRLQKTGSAISLSSVVADWAPFNDMYSANDTTGGSAHNHSISSAQSWRVQAAVFLRIYMDGLS